MASILIQPKLKIGFVDTHDHIASFFKNILSARYDLEIDNDNPEFLLFGDDNFGNNNLKKSFLSLHPGLPTTNVAKEVLSLISGSKI